MDKIYQRCWVALKDFRKLFCAEKSPIVLTVELSLLQCIEERHKRELLNLSQKSREMDVKFQRDLKSEYYKGYGDAQADIFAAMRKEPDQYLAFTDNYTKKEDAKWIAAAEQASVEMDWTPKLLMKEDIRKTFDMIEGWTHGP